MYKKKIVCYWSPFISNVATVKAVFNSALSLNKFSKGKYDSIIIDVFGEWKNSKLENLNQIKFYNLNYIKYLFIFSSNGFLKSRIKYAIIFIISFFSLKNFLKKFKPDFLIIHLITSLPLFLNLFYNFDTKIILRISGKPKINLLRYFFWKITLKKIYKITFPTLESLAYFKSLKIVDQDKVKLLYDPVFQVRELVKKKSEEIKTDINLKKNNFYLAIGRLTKQKNFTFLVKCFAKLIKNNPEIKLVIIGEGEEEKKIKKWISNQNLSNNIFLVGHKSNVFSYLKNSKAFILSSLWEDPGFVLIEALISETLVLSSDCSNGPKEIVGKTNGILFKNNSEDDFMHKFKILLNLNEADRRNMIINAKKTAKKFSIFNHYKTLEKYLYSLDD